MNVPCAATPELPATSPARASGIQLSPLYTNRRFWVELYHFCPRTGRNRSSPKATVRSGLFGSLGSCGHAKFSRRCNRFSLKISPYSKRLLPTRAISIRFVTSADFVIVIVPLDLSVYFITYALSEQFAIMESCINTYLFMITGYKPNSLTAPNINLRSFLNFLNLAAQASMFIIASNTILSSSVISDI